MVERLGSVPGYGFDRGDSEKPHDYIPGLHWVVLCRALKLFASSAPMPQKRNALLIQLKSAT